MVIILITHFPTLVLSRSGKRVNEISFISQPIGTPSINLFIFSDILYYIYSIISNLYWV